LWPAGFRPHSRSPCASLLQLGVQQFERGELDAARATFEFVLEQDADNSLAIYELALTHYQQGELERALAILDDGRTLAVVDVSFGLPVNSLNRLSTQIPIIFVAVSTAQRKSGGDTSYEPYAMAFGSLVGTFIRAKIDPASHFAAGHYSSCFGPMVEAGHEAAFAHMILAPLNPEATRACLQQNSEEFAAFRSWTNSPQAQ
jgi:hypothetical protein